MSIELAICFIDTRCKSPVENERLKQNFEKVPKFQKNTKIQKNKNRPISGSFIQNFNI